MFLRVALLVWTAVAMVAAREVLELQGTNLELTLTTYKYLAVLFYDNSPASRTYRSNWALAAEDIGRLPVDCEIAQVTFSSFFIDQAFIEPFAGKCYHI
jgi:hypothetical protein